jgi:toxin FitB
VNVVDSSAWLAYFAGEPTADFFAEAIEDADLLLVPSVCLYEVFKVVLRERGEDEALQVAAAMEQGMVINLDSELALEAAFLGHQEKLPLADSIVYATARKHNAVLWTQDEHFAGKPNVHYQPKAR